MHMKNYWLRALFLTSLLSVTSACTALAANTASAETGELIFAKCEEYINVRSKASDDSKVVAKLYNHGAATVTGTEDGEWYQIESGEASGYVKADYFATGSEAKAIAKEVAYNVAVVYPEHLNIRALPSEEAEVIGVAEAYDELEVVQYDGGWMKVALGHDIYGYVSPDYCEYKTYYPTAVPVEGAVFPKKETEASAGEESFEETVSDEAYYEEEYTEPEDAGQEYVEDYSDSGEEYIEDNTGSGEEYIEDYSDSGEEYIEDNTGSDEEYIEDNSDSGEEYIEDNSDSGEEYIEDNGEEITDDVSDEEFIIADDEDEVGSSDITSDDEYYASEESGDANEVSDFDAEIEFDDGADSIYYDSGTDGSDYTENYDASSDASSSETASSGNSSGQAIADYALQFVGNPYVYGGTSLTNGTDCSGFTQSVMSNFGIDLPRTAADQAGSGSDVSTDDLQAGDLLFYSDGGDISHVAMYIGDGQIVHASTEDTGIIVSDYDYSTPVSAKRYY